MDFDFSDVRQVFEAADDYAANKYLDAGWVLLRVAERRGEDRSELVYVLAWTQVTEPVWP